MSFFVDKNIQFYVVKYMYDFNPLRIPTVWNLEEHNLTLLALASGASLCPLDWHLLFTGLSLSHIHLIRKWLSFGNVSWMTLKLHSVCCLGSHFLTYPAVLNWSWKQVFSSDPSFSPLDRWLLRNCESCLSVLLLVYHSTFYSTYFMWVLFVCFRQSLTIKPRMA